MHVRIICISQNAAGHEGCGDSTTTVLFTVSGSQQSNSADREPKAGTDQHAGEQTPRWVVSHNLS